MIHRDHQGAIEIIRLDHGKANTMDVELLGGLTDALREAERGPARAVVITGTGSIFSAGVDLHKLLEGGRDYVQRFVPALDMAFTEVFMFPKPLVAAVNGHAIAGGGVITCACDRRIMADGRGRIGVPELLVGLPFPALGLEILRFATCPQHLQELIYSGRACLPSDARAHGLVDEVVPAEALLERARTVAGEMAAVPAQTFRLTKQALRQPVLDAVARNRAYEEDAARFWSSDTALEAIRAYVEKTIPKRS